MYFSLFTSREIIHGMAFVAGEEYASMIKWSTNIQPQQWLTKNAKHLNVN
jgi:hypothetical protein